MPHNVKSESLSGQLQQLLFSPKGGIEGLLLQVDHKPLQISMKPGSADAKALNDAVGKPLGRPANRMRRSQSAASWRIFTTPNMESPTE
jgi:hypothetical protein